MPTASAQFLVRPIATRFCMPMFSKSEHQRSTTTSCETHQDCICSTLDLLADASFCAAPFASAAGSARPFAVSSLLTATLTTSSTSPRLHASLAHGLQHHVSTLTISPAILTIAAGHESPVAWRASADPSYRSARSFPIAGSTTATSSRSGTACEQFICPDTRTDTWASIASVSGSCSVPTFSPAIAASLTFHPTSSTPRPSYYRRARPPHWHLTSPESSPTIATVPAPKNIYRGFAYYNASPYTPTSVKSATAPSLSTAPSLVTSACRRRPKKTRFFDGMKP